jgi:hypothetical protein
MRSYRKFGAALCASVLVFSVSLAGCGGGGDNGGGNNNGGNSQQRSRSASAVTVQSARTAVASLIAARRFGGGGRKVNFAHLSKLTRQFSEGLEYDEDYGLYYNFVQTNDTAFRVNYYEDEAGSVGAGFIEFAQIGETSARIKYDIRSGLEPQSGELTIVADDESGETGRITGSIRDASSNTLTAFNLRSNADGTTTGEMSATEDGVTVRFTNLVIYEDGRLASDIEFGEIRGRIQQNADESGRLELFASDGTYVAEYDAEGRGTLTEPNGTVTNIDDFDTYDAE